ncbi:hypothetical protein [Leptospira biflexa]|uniref:hypothetical protein n=2 Tax=Leptospira biflexa TaxID=172 RepID=UPI001FEE5FD7|nr:hypothetical protein [Leptospira biflexa]
MCLWLSLGGEMVANPKTSDTKDKSVSKDSKTKIQSSYAKNRKLKTSSVVTSTSAALPPIILKNHKGNWKPLELLWEESSGAVAPEFRYAKKYLLITDTKKIYLTRRVIKNGKLDLDETKEIQPKMYQKWMNALFEKGIHQLPMEEIPEEQVTGISYNFVTFRFSSTKSKFYYQLDEINQPNWEKKKEIIDYIERMKP